MRHGQRHNMASSPTPFASVLRAACSLILLVRDTELRPRRTFSPWHSADNLHILAKPPYGRCYVNARCVGSPPVGALCNHLYLPDYSSPLAGGEGHDRRFRR
jgi:hypothetical protein